MDAVVDTVSCKHLVRNLQPRKDSKREIALDIPISERRLRLAFDKDGGIIDEWRRTCGNDVVGVLMAKWEPIGGIFTVDAPNVPRQTLRKLVKLGFQGQIDKLVLRVGLAIDGRRVVSDDSHFWKPGTPASRGDKNAPVAKICRDDLGVQIMLLANLLNELAV